MDKELIQTILDTNHSIIVGLDYNNICRIFSRGAEKVTGYNRSEILGKKWNEIFLAFEDQEKLDALWKHAWDIDYDRFTETIKSSTTINQSWETISKQEVYNVIGPLKIRSGEIRSIFWQNTKIHQSADIKDHLLISIGMDITEQKNFEKHILDQNMEFESLNEELKQINDELHKAKLEAEESSRLKTAFLNNISHEFRTPMNGILGFTDLLLKPDISLEDKKKYAEIIRKSCNKLLETVTDTVDVSEIQSNITTINESPFSINELVQEILEQSKPKADEKGLPIIYEPDPGTKHLIIETDRHKLKRSLLHLLDNALKFTKKGEIRISCLASNDQVVISIIDTGIGIPEDMQGKIFEPFQQANIDHEYNLGGNGIGLSLVKAYVDLLGGNLEMKSKPNSGTSFKMSIPIKHIRIEKSKDLTGDKIRENWPEKRILIAEDEDVNFQYLKLLLEGRVLEIMHAKDGKEAVDISKNEKIDLILMDLKMPSMNGYEASRQIKRIHPKIPIIAQTAYASDNDIEEIKEKGFDDYLAKPFKRLDLLRVIEKNIGS